MNALSTAEQNALQVSYNVLGTHVELNLDFVTKYLVRGNAEYVTPQEVIFFMNTCKMQGLNPLVNGEVYLIKYDKATPAQMVVGKHAYLRRAYENPDYICKQDGITVKRGNDIVQKEGNCVYPGEQLIGGWCRVSYLRNGKELQAFREVGLAEYNTGKSVWREHQATMINKVAVSQCIREAFPKDYQGVYSEDEIIATDAIPANCQDMTETQQDVISPEQRQELFKKAKDALGDTANDVVKEIISKFGYTSTVDMKITDYNKVMFELDDIILNSNLTLDEEDNAE